MALSDHFSYIKFFCKKMTPGGYAQISGCYVVYMLCYSIAGHSLDALMYHKTSYLQIA